MCGGINIYYGIKEIEYENSGQMPDPNVTFQIHELEKQEWPLPNDLILNSDGCFYRVDTVAEEGIATVRLTLQGTGGGGGGGNTPGDSTGSASYSINVVPLNNTFSSQAEEMIISFQGIASAETETYISRVAFTMGAAESENNPAFYEESGYYAIGTLANPKIHTVDLVKYKDLFGSSTKTLYLNTTDVYGTVRSKKFTIQVVDLTLTEYEDVIIKSNEDIFSYSCTIGGAKSGITNKKLVVSLYSEDNLTAPVIPPQEIAIENSYNGTKVSQLNLTNLNHGVYVLQVQMQANISGSDLVIYSNVLTHKLIRFVSGSSNALFAVNIPNKIEQYTNATMSFMVASSEENKTYTVDISIDGINKTLLSTTTNQLNTYTLYFENKGNYTLTTTIVEMSSLTQTFPIQVVEYSGNLPVINPSDSSLLLYLTPKGRSNDAVDRNKWNDYNNRYTADLTGVYYSDNSGWLEDSDGTAYLHLTSGGKLTIPGFYPFAEDPTKPSNLNSAMGKGMTIELDFKINGVTDYDAELIKCISKDANNNITVGFSITGNKIRFYNSSKSGGDKGSLVNMSLIEDKRIRLSFVIEPNDSKHDFPMCLTYLNGKISGAAIYSKKDNFIQSLDEPAELIINSANAQISIYSIRFYTNALSDSDILNNYTASLPTLDERQDRFDSNNVYNEEGLIDYEDVSAEHYDLQIPYMTIIGGWACNPDDKWQMLPADKVGKAALPTGKKDYRMIDVSVVYPKNEYFKNYKNYTYTNIFENGLGMMDNFGNKPVNKTGCIMYAQGTSSMEYPVKNLRLRFRNKNHYFTVRPDISPVEIICMKADYMESSGSHNTGAANLVDDLYKGASLATPGQKHFGPTEENPDNKTIVTCIKGHPCLIFWSPDGSKGSFQYIGKYNLNLDKATPEPFGFNHDDSDFGYLKPGDKYYAIQYDDDGDKFIGQLKPADGGDYDDTKDGEELKQVQDGEKVNSIHCFEFLDNAIPVCNFLRRPKAYVKDEEGNLVPDPTGGYYTYEETWYNGFEDGGDILPGWTFGFESRYPEDRIGYHDADMLYPLASWLSELYYLKTEGSNGDGNPTQKDIDLANTRFKNEYLAYFNKDFLLFYYIVTEALLMADSRVKNMMIATWGKENKYSYYPLVYKQATQTWEPDTTQSPIVTDYYKWYPIFYDLDTMLGLDNTGVNRFNYYDEDDDPSTYNGDEILWNFVRDNLTLELDGMYNKLEKAGLNIDLNEQGDYLGTSVIPYFNNNQANMANEAFYNGDAQYKYIRPAVEGYWDGLNNVQINAGEAPYLYAAQGDRSLDREYFLTNRIKFLRGKRGSEDFKTNDRITFRLYYPTGQEANFKETVQNTDGTTTVIDHSNSVAEGVAPPSDTFTFESLQTCYAGVLIGANGHVVKERFDGEEKKAIKVQEAQSANGTEAYLLGVSSLKDLGDLSDKYPQKFIMSGQNKLRSLTFGNPHKDYYNPFWRPEEGNSTPIGLSGCTYLQSFNLQNCKTYNAEIDFSACPVIETILLTGSSTSNLTLPVNGIIKELRLPTTITSLSIDSHQYLTKDGFSIGTYNYGSDNKIGGNGNYVNDYTQLSEVTIINTPIDTYDMVSHAAVLQGYYFEGFNWDIIGAENDDQYLTTKDEAWDDSKTYYIWNPTSKSYVVATLKDYEAYPARIKEKYPLIENGKIVRIPILDYLQTKAARKNQIAVDAKSALTGTITIKARARVDQFELYQMYNGKYPNVTIAYDEDAIGSSNITRAYKVEFFNAPNIDEKSEAYYTVLTNGTYTLADLVSATGPAGIALTTPSIQSTNDTVYVFTKKWRVVDLENPDAEERIFDMTTDEWSTYRPTSDLKLEPIYNAETRYYSVKFYNHEEQLFTTVQYTYNQIMSDNSDTPLFIERPDDADLTSDYYRYTFKGWITEKDFKNLDKVKNPEVIDLTTKAVTFETSYYPYHIQEDCRTTPSNLDYFDFAEESVSVVQYKYVHNTNDPTTNPQYIDLGKLYTVKIKDKYNGKLSGKITIPNADANGRPVTAFSRLDYKVTDDGINPLITDVFFLPNSQCQVLLDHCFSNSNVLKRIYFPENMNNLKYILNQAFINDNALEKVENLPNSIIHIDDSSFKYCSSLELTALPSNLTYLGAGAFHGCSKLKLEKLPHGVTQLLNNTFYNCGGLTISHFGHIKDGPIAEIDNALTHIGSEAFAMPSESMTIPASVYLHNSLVYLGSGCFRGYGKRDGFSVFDGTEVINEDNVYDYFGVKDNLTFSEVDSH